MTAIIWQSGIKDRAVPVSAVSFLVPLVNLVVQRVLRILRGLPQSGYWGHPAVSFYRVPCLGLGSRSLATCQ